MTTTRTRSRGRTGSRASAAHAGAERKPMIIASAAGVAILLAFAALATSVGHIVLAATDHFMLKYSGVFALMLLTGTTCMGVLATDRIILNPGHRVIAQAVHRAVAFGTLAFLVVHIVLEITAPHLEESKTLHVHLLDAFIPFLSQYRTFYMAEGTIASDIIILLVITGILRRRFTANGNAWKWRAIHYANYAALILGVLHGLLAGRKAIGTFVYWSYGAVLAMLAIAVLVRILATSLRTKEMIAGAAPPADNRGSSSAQSMPVRAAALGLMDQMSGAMPLGGATRAGPALQGGNPGSAVPFPSPYAPVAERARAIAALPDPAHPGPALTGLAQRGRMPRYESGYDGPPRYEGAPAPRLGDRAGQGPDTGYGTGPQPAYGTAPRPSHRTGPQPIYETGPQPANGTGPQPSRRTGPQPAYRLAPEARHGTGPQPVYPPPSAAGPPPAYPAASRPGRGTGPQPVYPSAPPERESPAGYGTEPQPGYRTGSRGLQPVYDSGPQPVYDSGPRAGRERPYGQDHPYGADPAHGPGYGPDPGYGQDQGYDAEPRYEPGDYGPDPGYRAAPRRTRDGYGGPPPGYRTGPSRPQPPATQSDERTGPLPRVPSYGGDERP